jgi:hypothetical protein
LNQNLDLKREVACKSKFLKCKKGIYGSNSKLDLNISVFGYILREFWVNVEMGDLYAS